MGSRRTAQSARAGKLQPRPLTSRGKSGGQHRNDRKSSGIRAAGAPARRPTLAHTAEHQVIARADRRHAGEDDQRTRFQRDRDRILYTTALRRLAGVTQVAAAGEAYVFHNRLTHTLEVAQIARRIAERLAAEERDAAEALGGIDPDVCEAAALAHDLGHPPFGHIAEEILNEVMVGEHIRDGFEGNAQSFRIVTALAVRNEHPGLNLTAATLNAILKYPTLQTESGDPVIKWGAYRTETADFEFARSLGPALKTSAEAEIMDLGDDIGYAIHDVEDFFRAGLIPLDRLAQNDGDNDEVEAFFLSCKRRWARLGGRRPKYRDGELRAAFRRIIATIPIREPFVADRRQRAKLRQTTAYLIRDYVTNASLKPSRDRDGQCVLIGKPRRMEITMLKELTWTYVIDNPALATQQRGQRHIVRELFAIFAEALSKERYALFPASARERIEEASGNHEAKLRVICDLIAGLTEREAIDLYRRLVGVDFGSVLDRFR